MPVDIDRTLKNALRQLNIEKARIDRQILAVEGALEGTNRRRRPRRGPARRTRARRKGMNAAARKAVSARMKAYWAKRKKIAGKRAR